MKVHPQLADQIFTALVETIGTPNIEHLRWAFVYAVVIVETEEYRIDSKLGMDGRLINLSRGIPTVTLTTKANAVQTQLIKKANNAIQEIVHIKQAKKITPIRIIASHSVQAVQVMHMTPDSDMTHLKPPM